MGSVSLSRRLQRLEEPQLTTWRNQWADFAYAFRRHVRVDLLDYAKEHAIDDESAWREYAASVGVLETGDWLEASDLMPADPERPDLTLWPDRLPVPPEEPEGVREHLERDQATGEQPRAAFAALGLVLLGIADAVREATA